MRSSNRANRLYFESTTTTEIYTLSLHDALPISRRVTGRARPSLPRRMKTPRTPLCASRRRRLTTSTCRPAMCWSPMRSEEHTSELQSRLHLVCRLLLEKKNPCAEEDSLLDTTCL